jgi:nucleoside-diphosphate-sugar epimerase
MNPLRGKRILVTGATGFIGGRLVERLVLDEGAEVVAMVHQWRNASRLARFPLVALQGDITDPEFVRSAAKGCDAIVHCAVTFSGSAEQNRAVTVEGARNVCEAAVAHSARLVHFSTFSVYGLTPPGPLTEDSPKLPGKDAYGTSKLAAEQIVQSYQSRGLRATILQPTVVYGPWSFWSRHAISQLEQGTVVLPDGGRGICNAVFVDDVVEAAILALLAEKPAAGPYLISAASPVTWKEYYKAHGQGLSVAAVDSLSEVEKAGKRASWSLKGAVPAGIRFHLRGLLAEVPGMRAAYRCLKGVLRRPTSAKSTASHEYGASAASVAKRRVLPYADHVGLMSLESVVRVDRAQRELGYNASFDLARGSKVVSQWAEWTKRT